MEKRRVDSEICAAFVSPLPDAAQTLAGISLPTDLGESPAADDIIRKVLFHPGTSLDSLKAMKSYAKTLVKRAGTQVDRVVALAVYYAAIAGGHLTHNEKISSHPYDYLRQAFGELIAQPWLPPDIAEHFRRAQERSLQSSCRAPAITTQAEKDASDFGDFEPVREVHRHGNIAAFTARRAGTAEGEPYLLKVLSPSILWTVSRNFQPHVLSFLERAEAQRHISAKGAKHWAVVHKTGRTMDGAYAAMDRHDRSAMALVDKKLKLQARDLSHIILAVVDGLLELEQLLGRAHGALTAHNVLLSGKKMPSARIALTDPAVQSVARQPNAVKLDLVAVGQLIHQLVMRRPLPARRVMQAVDCEEWRRLGRRSGEGWRSVCADLLVADIVESVTSYKAIRDRIRSLG